MRPSPIRGSLAAILLGLSLVLAACAGSGATTVLDAVGDSAGNPEPAAAAPRGGEELNVSGGGGNGEAQAVRDEARIIYTGSLSIQVPDLDAAVAAGRTAVDGLGGYVGASQVALDGDQSFATITYRIPADRWEEGLARLRGLGQPVAEETRAAEVTAQIVDLEARIRNLRASETALQRIAAEATAVKDILDVEKRLTEVRGQIEQLDAQRTNLEDQAAYGTLAVTYGEQVVAIVEAAKGWNPGQEVDQASATLVDVLQALTTAGIWFAIVWLPILVAILILVLVGRFVLRRMGVIGRVEPQPLPEG